MSRKNQTDLKQRYQGIAKVTSPAGLDQRILAEARRLAPERESELRKFFAKHRMLFTATVCMIGLAVVITKPVLFNLSQPEYRMQAPVEEPGQTHSAATMSDFPKDSALQLDVMELENQSKFVQEENSKKLKERQSVSAPVVSASVVSESSIAEKKESQELDQPDQITSQPVTAATPSSSPNGVSLGEILDSMSASTSGQLSDESTSVKMRISDSELVRTLDQIRSLIEANDLEAAQSLLAELKLRCLGCEIPDLIDHF